MSCVSVLLVVLVLLETQASGLLIPAPYSIDELYGIIGQLNASLKHLETTVAKQNASLKQMEITATHQNATMKQMEQTVAQQTATLKQLEHTVANQNATIVSLLQQGSLNNKTVGFYAKVSHEMNLLGDEQTIDFGTVVTNVGNAYDPRHSHFSAPVKGMYLISVSIMSKDNTIIFCELIKNRDVVTGLYGAAVGSQSDTQTVVLELSQGDMLFVRHTSSRPNEKLNGYNSYFSGFLIKPF